MSLLYNDLRWLISDKLHIVEKILMKATQVLCDNLQPKDILISLKSRGTLTTDDVERIESEKTTSDKVEKLLDILNRKPVSAYDMFMEILREKRPDLFEIVHAIEIGFQYGQTGEL